MDIKCVIGNIKCKVFIGDGVEDLFFMKLLWSFYLTMGPAIFPDGLAPL